MPNPLDFFPWQQMTTYVSNVDNNRRVFRKASSSCRSSSSSCFLLLLDSTSNITFLWAFVYIVPCLVCLCVCGYCACDWLSASSPTHIAAAQPLTAHHVASSQSTTVFFIFIFFWSSVSASLSFIFSGGGSKKTAALQLGRSFLSFRHHQNFPFSFSFPFWGLESLSCV